MKICTIYKQVELKVDEVGKKEVDGMDRSGREETAMLCVSLVEQLSFQYI